MCYLVEQYKYMKNIPDSSGFKEELFCYPFRYPTIVWGLILQSILRDVVELQ